MDQRRSSGSSGRSRQPSLISPTVVGSLILGICIIIASSNIAGKITKLNATIENTQFASTMKVPENISVSATAQRTYLTDTEAAQYLNLSDSTEVVSLIKNGEITEYIQNSKGGYSISKEALDDWFYEQVNKNNAPVTDE
ncbi:MAG: helix-turn-helix domain-containing protein [Oscillospiraceae bacterium]|nr:helix-turn-helix domain-containing protein [Oscillospiraceae bacterium]